MTVESFTRDWAAFLGRPVAQFDLRLAEEAVAGRTVLITGAGGSIGSSLARTTLVAGPRRLVLLDISEAALYESLERLPTTSCKVVPVIGSVGDGPFLQRLLERWRPELIFHAAAYKHVPLMEQNPLSALANNSVGTYKLALAARQAGVRQLVCISTDKAVNPASVMGLSKRISELAGVALSSPATPMTSVRLCNVLGSSGSAALLFARQAELGRPLTLTHAEAKRYFVSPLEAETAILRSAVSPLAERGGGRILLPECGEAFSITRLAKFMSAHYQAADGREPVMKIIGLRPGDKLEEELMAADEHVEWRSPEGMQVVASPSPSASEMMAAMEELGAAIEANSLEGAMSVAAELVPTYRALHQPAKLEKTEVL